MTINDELPLTDRDVQTIMDSLFDIRAGVTLLIAELIDEDDENGSGEEEEN